MRRASSLLSSLRSLKNHSANKPVSFISLSLRSDLHESSHPQPCKIHRGLLYKRKLSQFLRNPSRNLDTLVQKEPPLPSRQRKLQEKNDLDDAFESATTLEEMLSAFKSMEAVFDENDKRMGLACLKLGQCLDSIGEDHQSTLLYANRALRILEFHFDDNDDCDKSNAVSLAMALHLMGSVNYNLKRFNESLGYLNRANRILGTLESESSGFDVRPILHAVHLLLANTKTAMGRREEALENLRKSLELKELLLEPQSKELGVAYREVAEAYAAVLRFKEALPIGLKALDLHIEQLGQNSVEVAHDRRLLGVVYCGLEEHQKALDQNQLAVRVLKNWGMSADLLKTEVDAANIQIALGKFEEAINILRGVVQQTDKDSEARALVFITMAKALCNQEKFTDGKRCCEIACGILDKKESLAPSKVAEAYSDIAMLYETMNEFESAISLLKKSLALLEKIPQEQHAEAGVSGRIGWLLLLTGKVPQAIPYLESAAERLKESFGPKHFGVGYIYNNLGAAYMELDRPQSAAQTFALAKDIMDVSLGPHHADSIEACQNLANAYGAMKSYKLASEFQQQVIGAWRSHGPAATDEVQEAERLLLQLEKKAIRESLFREDPIPLPESTEVISGNNMEVNLSK